MGADLVTAGGMAGAKTWPAHRMRNSVMTACRLTSCACATLLGGYRHAHCSTHPPHRSRAADRNDKIIFLHCKYKQKLMMLPMIAFNLRTSYYFKVVKVPV